MESKQSKKEWIDPYEYAGLKRVNEKTKNDSTNNPSFENQEEIGNEANNMKFMSNMDKDKLLASLTTKFDNVNKKIGWKKVWLIPVFISITLLGVVSWRFLSFNDDCYISSSEMKVRLMKLQRNLNTRVYGQHIAVKSTFNAIQYHVMDPRPEKPLVLSFHGGVGTGKTFVAEIIAENLFKGGLKNKHVKSYLGPKHFYTDPNKVHEIKIKLSQVVESTVSECSRSLFIFDEADKMLPGVLDGVAPFLGYNSNIDGIDYSKAIFIFLSNTGTDEINSLTLDSVYRDKQRRDLGVLHFRRMIQDGSFNDKGGLSKCDMILQRNVDHYIPFLPLEKKHVLLCIKHYLDRKEIYNVYPEDIAKRNFYLPPENPTFAYDGCKNIAALVDPFLHENTNIFQDEF